MVPSHLGEVWKGPKWGPKWPLLGVLLACFWRSQIEMMNLRSRSGSGSPLWTHPKMGPQIHGLDHPQMVSWDPLERACRGDRG